MKLNEEQIKCIRDSLVLYHDYNRTPPGYLRLCYYETEHLPHGISLGLSATHETQEEIKTIATEWLVDFIEGILEDK